MKSKKFLKQDVKTSIELIILSGYMFALGTFFNFIIGKKIKRGKPVETTRFVLFVNDIMNKMALKFSHLEGMINYRVRDNVST